MEPWGGTPVQVGIENRRVRDSSILGLMLAIVIALPRPALIAHLWEDPRWEAIPLVAIGVVAIYLLIVSALLPEVARRQAERGNNAGAVALLRLCIALPSLLRKEQRVQLRFQLAQLYLQMRHYEDGARHLQTLLGFRLRPEFEAVVHQRLADCLEGSGQTEQAATEREKATVTAGSVSRGDLLLAQALEMERQGKYSEACDRYKKALEEKKKAPPVQRAQILTRLALALAHAGQGLEAAHRAEEAIRLNPGDTICAVAHGAAGLGYVAVGDLEKAEKHRRDELGIARSQGNPTRIARALTRLAGIQLRCARLDEALNTCREAGGLSREALRDVKLAEAEIYQAQGRFNEALEAIKESAAAPGHGVPAFEKRSQAILKLAISRIQMEADRPEAASRPLQEAEETLRSDQKLGLWCDATAAQTLAMLGRWSEARDRCRLIEAKLPEMEADRPSRILFEMQLGRVALLQGDAERSEQWWRRCLSDQLDPVSLPIALYYLGESLRIQGRSDAAMTAFQEAVDTGFETRYVQLSRQRLEELGSSSPS